MIKVQIISDEWYPVYSIRENPLSGEATEMYKSDLEYMQRMFKDFEKLQKRLRLLYIKQEIL